MMSANPTLLEIGVFWRLTGVYLRRAENAETKEARLSYGRLALRCHDLAEAEDAAEAARLGLSPTHFVDDEQTEDVAQSAA
jgi:hypothetical protein